MRPIATALRDPRRRVPAVLCMLVLLAALAALGTSLTRGQENASWSGPAGTDAAPTAPGAAAVPAPPTRDPVQATPGAGGAGARARPPPAPPVPGAAAGAGTGAVVRYTFDAGLADMAGLLPLRVV